ncbi:MAG: PLDc N-terminal domain-containing protein [Ornithinibacter sp.]
MNSFWDFFWFMVLSFVFIAFIMLLFHIVVDLMRDDSVSGWGKTFWAIFLIFLPFLGAFVYLIARGSGMAERQLRQAKEYQDQQAEYIRSVAAPADPVNNLAQAKSLLDSGAITQAEFDTIKAKALA